MVSYYEIIILQVQTKDELNFTHPEFRSGIITVKPKASHIKGFVFSLVLHKPINTPYFIIY